MSWSSVSDLILGKCTGGVTSCCKANDLSVPPPRIHMYQDETPRTPLASIAVANSPEEIPTLKLSARRGKDSARGGSASARGAPSLRTIQEDQEATPQSSQKDSSARLQPDEIEDQKQLRLSSSDGELLMDHALRSFTATMQQDVEVQVLLDDGQLLDVVVALNASATELVLRVNGTARTVSLDDVERVCCPEEAAKACTANSSHLSEKCVTLVLSSTHFLTFVFETDRLGKYFEMCLRALVVAHHTKKINDAKLSLGGA